ncbi:MAG TPA: methylated-DNA--[protein]-cysteine S-methyltransferase [Actinomycetota bacterium]|nr:methylated-DNA--[protein]-cysteine S-methyltransferase [Actinomycetota bacterium]
MNRTDVDWPGDGPLERPEAPGAVERWVAELARRAEQGAAALVPRVAEEAHRRGLVELAYGFAHSPFGPLLVAVSRRGLVRVAYPDRDVDRELERLAREVSPRIVESARATDAVRRELEEYFEGRRRRFEVRPDLSLVRGFSRRVLEATARVPFGTLATYREVAGRAGSPGGYRAAGNALGSNPVPIVVPCHRVVRTGGDLGGYTGGVERKLALLRLEGVQVPAPRRRPRG